MKFLLAEDDKTTQMSVKTFCKKSGVDIEVVGDGKQALDLCTAGNKYDVILMDNFMPELDGMKATNLIRSLEHGSAYVIYLLSGIEDVGEEELKKAGFDGFIKKPMNKTTFEGIVNKAKEIS